MFKIPLRNHDTSTLPDHGIRFGCVQAFYLTMDVKHAESTECDLIIKHLDEVKGMDKYWAERKVTEFMAKNKMSDWTWTGCWWTEGGRADKTYYALFQRHSDIVRDL